MGLNTGNKLGPYEILSPLGAGGMGEVYRARDTKLNRDVALKVLPESLSNDAERMARFKREAQVLASLNHPNIATIYGFEETEGIRALAMELVEGQTLAEIISARHGVPAKESLPIAKQIADALEYAHERGIIHRDLKPANVKVTPEGTVKVLDFGLAKALQADPSSSASNVSNSPTLTVAATQAGVIIGTAAYMSPEQARGKAADRRADIWSFGCVLYEMLAGKRLFEGETVSDTLAGVLMKEPDWSALPQDLPPKIHELVRRCLVKEPKQRLQSIGDARIAIEEAISGVGAGLETRPYETGAVSPPRPNVLPWILTAVFAMTALIAFLYLWRTVAREPHVSPVLSYIPPPPGTAFHDFGFGEGPVVVSPDGRQLAFSATDENGVTKLYVRPLDLNQAKAISGTEDAGAPFWSPDGSAVGFFADHKLKTVNLSSGNVQTLADASPTACSSGGAWSPNGTIIFTPKGCGGPLSKIPASGGTPSAATALESGGISHGSPSFLPDGKHFLFVSLITDSSGSVMMGSLDSLEAKLVLQNAGSPQFASGNILFIRDGRVFAQRFDPTNGNLAGEDRALAEAQAFSVSENGELAFQGGTPKGRMQWFDRGGNPLGDVGPVAIYNSVKISPDGSRVLAEVADPQSGGSNLWSYPATGGVGTRLTYGPGEKEFTVWSPDGKFIAYSCDTDGKLGYCRKASDGSGTEEKLSNINSGLRDGLVNDWSPDGRYLTLNEKNIKESRTVMSVLPLFGDRKPFQPAPVSSDQFDGRFSPDGHWLAYFSYESGRPEVYVVPFPGPGGKFQISQNGGWNVHWDKKGHLYFQTLGARLMEADLGLSGGAVQVKSIHPLFQLNIPSFADPFYDVNADGSRFLVVTSADPNASRSIGLLLDWKSMLKDAK